ncbi:MAG TPA: DUF481 domain-containing protein [Steroidobacteraceae bacterium]|nr:DUF481 domain-containing protein [Steroidobacteraceae bacterium]
MGREAPPGSGALGTLFAVLTLPGLALADEDSWAARAQAGYTKTGGTTDTSSANALFHIAYVLGDWKLLFGLDGLYGATRGETTAQAWSTYLQGQYNINPRLYWYSALRYEDNRFSGFAYQETASTGLGYQFIKTDATKLTGQLGGGVRRLQPEEITLDAIGGIISTMKLPSETDAVLDASLTYEHSFNAATKLLAGVNVEAGQQNTMTNANITLQVKMTNTLALSAGYQVTHNSEPPAGVGTTSTLTTLNLVYEHKNPKLAPE